jgi:hypothetical protein
MALWSDLKSLAELAGKILARLDEILTELRVARAEVARLGIRIGDKLERLESHVDAQFEEAAAKNNFRFFVVESRLDEIIRQLQPPEAARIVFQTMGEEIDKMQMKVTQKLPLEIKLVDKFGNAAVADGAPAWSVSDPALGDLVVAEGGMSAEFTPKGATGSCLVQVSADADLGEGMKAIMGSLPVDLLPGEAVEVQVSAGAPVDMA